MKVNWFVLSLLLVGAGLLVFSCFAHPASAVITYVPESNYINTNVNSTTANGTWAQSLYDADKGGILNLSLRTNTTKSAVNLPLTYRLRIADYKYMGSPRKDLWVNVTAWSGFTGCIIKINGTALNGSAQSENFTFNGTGGQNSSKVWVTLTHSNITYVAGAGSVTWRVTQGQWGRIEKLGERLFFINRTEIRKSTRTDIYETNTTFIFIHYSASVCFRNNRYGSFVFGNLSVNRTGRWGCNFVLKGTGWTNSIILFQGGTLTPNYLNLSGCHISFDSRSSGYFTGSSQNLNMYDCSVKNIYISAQRNGNISRVSFSDANAGFGGFLYLPLCDNIILSGIRSYTISLTTSVYSRLTMTNTTIVNSPVSLFYGATNTQGNHFFRNFKFDYVSSTKAYWGASGTGTIYRQYGFSPHIVYNVNTSNVSGAVVSIYQQKNYTGAFELCGSFTSDYSGSIGYKWLNHSKYWYPGVDGVYKEANENYTIRIIISKNGYDNLTINKVFNAEDKSIIVLCDSQEIQIRDTFIGNYNPANTTNLEYNYIMKNQNGINTSIEIKSRNFTIFNESSLGLGHIIDNVIYTSIKRNYTIYGNKWVSQLTFVSGKMVINKVILYGRRNGNPSGNLTVSYRPYNGSYPSEIDTCIGSIPCLSIPTSNNFFTVYLNKTYLLPYDSIINHGIVIRAIDGNETNNITLCGDIPIALDEIGLSNDSGISWDIINDSYFRYATYAWTLTGTFTPYNLSNSIFINVDLYSNTSGTYQKYYSELVFENKTIFKINTNMTDEETTYYWNPIITDFGGTLLFNEILTFNTNNNDFLFIAGFDINQSFLLLSIFFGLLYYWWKSEDIRMMIILAMIIIPYDYVVMTTYLLPLYVTDATILLFMQGLFIILSIVIGVYTLENWDKGKKNKKGSNE